MDDFNNNPKYREISIKILISLDDSWAGTVKGLVNIRVSPFRRFVLNVLFKINFKKQFGQISTNALTFHLNVWRYYFLTTRKQFSFGKTRTNFVILASSTRNP